MQKHISSIKSLSSRSIHLRFYKSFDNITAIFEEVDVIPKTDKREAKEESENSPKFSDKVGERVD